jgi:hypothetical protein
MARQISLSTWSRAALGGRLADQPNLPRCCADVAHMRQAVQRASTGQVSLHIAPTRRLCLLLLGIPRYHFFGSFARIPQIDEHPKSPKRMVQGTQT